ncbi:MAG: tetratricopeptide repeat protein [Rickettsia endosymbiont of Argas persicus]
MIGDYKKAEQYLSNILKIMPDDDVIINLFNVYISTNKITEEKKILNNLSSENTQNFLNLSFEINNITKEKLKSIDKKNLSLYLLNIYKYYEYVSIYNM